MHKPPEKRCVEHFMKDLSVISKATDRVIRPVCGSLDQFVGHWTGSLDQEVGLYTRKWVTRQSHTFSRPVTDISMYRKQNFTKPNLSH